MSHIEQLLADPAIRSKMDANISKWHDAIDSGTLLIPPLSRQSDMAIDGKYAPQVLRIMERECLYEQIEQIVREQFKIPPTALEFLNSGEEAIVFRIAGLEERNGVEDGGEYENGHHRPTFLLKLSPASRNIDDHESYLLNRPVHKEHIGKGANEISIAIVPYVPHAYKGIAEVGIKRMESHLSQQSLELDDKKYTNFRFADDPRYPVVIDLRAVTHKPKIERPSWSRYQPAPPADMAAVKAVYEEIHKKLNRGVGYGLEAVHQLADAAVSGQILQSRVALQKKGNGIQPPP